MYVVTKNGIEKRDSALLDTVIRDISSKEELVEIIERMPYIQTIHAPNSRVRKELYQMAMAKYEDIEWVKVIKSVYIRMQDRRYDDFEPEFMDKAKEFLYTQISIRFDILAEKVEDYVNQEVTRHLSEF